MTARIDTEAAYWEAKDRVWAALAGTDRDNRMSAVDVLAATGELPLTLNAGTVAPYELDDLVARGAEIAGDSIDGYYRRKVRDNGRS
ncbi:hypothetical protein [Gordonia malaquae]|uniref:hypothetical protein n=1 Tax=Gordonia malaquae TaxID=410332 RepID=UPI003015BE78